MNDKTKGLGSVGLSDLDQLMIEGRGLPDDIDELERLLEVENIDRDALEFQRELARRTEHVNRKQLPGKQERPAKYKQVRDFSLMARDYVAMFFNGLFVVVGTIAGIIALFISETVSVQLGISTFFKEGAIAWLLAITVVVMYFSIEWRHSVLTHRHGRPASYRFTFATTVRSLKYLFSFDPATPLQEKPDTNDIKVVNKARLTLVMLIVILGILGRLDTKIATLDGAWHEALVTIVRDSTLEDFMGYTGGAILAFALLAATHFVVSYIYETYVVAVGVQEVSFFDESSLEQERQAIRIRMYKAYLMKRWQEKQALPAPVQETLSLPTSVEQ